MLLEMLPEALFGAFVSEVFSNCTGITKEKIKNAVKNRKNKHQNLESQIYNVIIGTLNIFTNNRYEDQDILYDAAENLLKGFQSREYDSIEILKIALRNLVAYVSDDTCKEFIKALCHELAKTDYIELYRKIMLLQGEQERRKASRIENKVDTLDQKMEKGFNEVKQGLENINKDSKEIDIEREEKFKNNKKQDYIKNWNSRLFLHLDNDEKPITLADAFIMPDYKIYKSIKRIGVLVDDTLEQTLEKFIQYTRTSTMLITGVPGIGKSTITSWIANKYETDDNVIILRFRDWEAEELDQGLLKAICKMLGCEKSDLNNHVIILDGFDEIKTIYYGEMVLNSFFYEIKDYTNFKCIITSRPAYIDSYYFHNVIEVQEFDIDKVEGFYEKITGDALYNKEKIESNLEVLGIPVILYMAIMSDANISENPTKPELYSRIFAEKGGIFDKFCYDGTEYDNGTQILRDPDNIKNYLEFLMKTSFRMFEKNKLVLLRKDCPIPCLELQGHEISVLEFPIKYFFENAKTNIEFIHKSIYEYFVSEYIYLSIDSVIHTNVFMEGIARVLGDLFKRNRLDAEILEFLKYKIRNCELNYLFNYVEAAFQKMLHDGMTYHTKKCYKKIISYEMNVFSNMLEFMHLWEDVYLIFDKLLYDYIKYNTEYYINLSNIDCKGESLNNLNLSRGNLQGAILSNVFMQNSDLCDANLRGADMRGIHLKNVDLSGADLRGADLIGIGIKNVNLMGTKFDEVNIGFIYGACDLDDTEVYINESSSFVSYDEYLSIQCSLD